MSRTKKYFTKIWSSQKGFLIFLSIFFITRGSVADHMRVPTGSMRPTIEVGDHILVNRLAYRLNLPFTQWGLSIGEPEPGDVVVFKHPKDQSTILVKRLIGRPGDHVEVSEGFVRINGEPLLTTGGAKELQSLGLSYTLNEQNGGKSYAVRRLPYQTIEREVDLVVPEGHYFFLGDNRDNSSDSRAWGLVPEDLLIGRAEATIFSVTFNDWLMPIVDWSRTALPM